MIRRFLLSFVVYFVLVAVSSAQVVMFRVQDCNEHSCKQYSCSAVAVGYHQDKLVLLSAGHCVDDAANPKAEVFVEGRWVGVEIVFYSVNGYEDVAILLADAETDTVRFMSGGRINLGDRMVVKGFANGRSYRERNAVFVSAGQTWIKCSGLPIQGESGGGMFFNGELVGILKGYPWLELTTVGTNSKRLKQIVIDKLGAIPTQKRPSLQAPDAPKEPDGPQDEPEDTPDIPKPPTPPEKPDEPKPPTDHPKPPSEPEAPDTPQEPKLPGSLPGGLVPDPTPVWPDLTIPEYPPKADLLHGLSDKVERIEAGLSMAFKAASVAKYFGMGATGVGGAAILSQIVFGLLRRRRKRKDEQDVESAKSRLLGLISRAESAVGVLDDVKGVDKDSEKGETTFVDEVSVPMVSKETITKNRIVPVDVTDLRGEAYAEALAKFAEGNPKQRDLIKHLEKMMEQIYAGKKTRQRMGQLGWKDDHPASGSQDV